MKKLPKSLLPSPKKIMKRGLYEALTITTKGKVKQRDYGKRMLKGKY